ncbi:MAG: transcriptional repressor [Verrucomicrobia bacterium]|nr:transcriptional repressor [Verrucomicrobiota bacterium]
MELEATTKARLDEALARAGQRSTRQRELVFATLLRWMDHPTADEVFSRAREQTPTISLATVYNCLETLVGCGLVRAVNYEREPTRYCPNLNEHAHFQDRVTGRISDIPLSESIMATLRTLLPPGYEADSLDLYFHGTIRKQPSKSTSKS